MEMAVLVGTYHFGRCSKLIPLFQVEHGQGKVLPSRRGIPDPFAQDRQDQNGDQSSRQET